MSSDRPTVPRAGATTGRRRRTARVGAAVAVVLASFVAGRLTAGRADPAPAVGADHAYLAGLRAGEAFGVAEGRALQEGAALPADARDPVGRAFADGYAAGTNDVFAGYDGGWRTGVPYVITLERGQGAVTYWITSRREAGPPDRS